MTTYEQARKMGLELARQCSADTLLVAVAAALEDWNIHELAAICRDQSLTAPAYLRGLIDNPFSPGNHERYRQAVEDMERLNSKIIEEARP